jgi:hypothetical protein
MEDLIPKIDLGPFDLKKDIIPPSMEDREPALVGRNGVFTALKKSMVTQ